MALEVAERREFPNMAGLVPLSCGCLSREKPEEEEGRNSGMLTLLHASSPTTLPRASCILVGAPSCGLCFPSWTTGFHNSGFRTANLEFLLARFRLQCYSIKQSVRGSSRKRTKTIMKDDREAFFVVRKDDLVGVYKSLSDCQAQVGTSVCDPPVSVYKGFSMPKDAEKYLLSCGLVNALYSIRASDLTEELFGTLVPCPIQPTSVGETSNDSLTKKRSQEAPWSNYGDAVGPTLTSNDSSRKHFKLDTNRVDQNSSACLSCTLEFDGSSKGNPGQSGAGAIIRSDDGSLICKLREGLGIATSNAAEYRGFILGLKYALGKGFTSVRVRGDSKLVCMQIQGLWRVKNQNIFRLYEEAKKLKDKFQSFQIIHVLRDLNSEADNQANLAVDLAEGQVREDMEK